MSLPELSIELKNVFPQLLRLLLPDSSTDIPLQRLPLLKRVYSLKDKSPPRVACIKWLVYVGMCGPSSQFVTTLKGHCSFIVAWDVSWGLHWDCKAAQLLLPNPTSSSSYPYLLIPRALPDKLSACQLSQNLLPLEPILGHVLN